MSIDAKTRRAIYQYVLFNLKGSNMIEAVVNLTLDTEQMPRAELYDWLEKRGYRYSSQLGWMREEKK